MRDLCKKCNQRPVAINYYKEGKPFYRSMCDHCSRNRTEGVPLWQKAGYKKKAACDLCGFKGLFTSQMTVFYIDGNLENTLFVAKNSNMTNLNNSLDKTYQFVYNKSIDPIVKWSDSQGLKFKTGIQLEQAKLGEFNEAFDKQAFI